MGDDTKQLIKYAAIAAAAYFVYEWLQTSGLWAQWFGTTAATNTFTDPTLLMNYCQANPTGSATYTVNGVSNTATCSQWIASNSATPVQTAPIVATNLATNYQQAIAQMQTAAGNDSQNLDNWSYFWQNGVPFAGAPTGYAVPGSISADQMNQMIALNGGNRDANISAEQFVAWVNQTGGATGLSALMSANEAYDWVF